MIRLPRPLSNDERTQLHEHLVRHEDVASAALVVWFGAPLAVVLPSESARGRAVDEWRVDLAAWLAGASGSDLPSLADVVIVGRDPATAPPEWVLSCAHFARATTIDRIEPCTLDDVLPLRHRVLRTGHAHALARFDGDTAPDTSHWAAFTGPLARCCLTMVRAPFEGDDAWQLRGMATDDGLRGAGLGQRVVAAALGALPAPPHPRRVWCNARAVAIPFYERLGWRVVSDRFEIPLAGPHVRMLFEVDGEHAPTR
jgi:predicted GNAT family N-acyltransferase